MSVIFVPLSSIAYPLKQISSPLVRSCMKMMGVNKLFTSFTTLYKSSNIVRSTNEKNLKKYINRRGEKLINAITRRKRLEVEKCLLYHSLVMTNAFK